MDALIFFIICAISLSLVSGMLYIRLASGGAETRTIAVLLVELWVSLVLAVVVLSAVSGLLGPGAAANPAGEFQDFVARWRHLSQRAQILEAIGMAAALALLIQALLTIRRAYRDYPL